MSINKISVKNGITAQKQMIALMKACAKIKVAKTKARMQILNKIFLVEKDDGWHLVKTNSKILVDIIISDEMRKFITENYPPSTFVSEEEKDSYPNYIRVCPKEDLIKPKYRALFDAKEYAIISEIYDILNDTDGNCFPYNYEKEDRKIDYRPGYYYLLLMPMRDKDLEN